MTKFDRIICLLWYVPAESPVHQYLMHPEKKSYIVMKDLDSLRKEHSDANEEMMRALKNKLRPNKDPKEQNKQLDGVANQLLELLYEGLDQRQQVNDDLFPYADKSHPEINRHVYRVGWLLSQKNIHAVHFALTELETAQKHAFKLKATHYYYLIYQLQLQLITKANRHGFYLPEKKLDMIMEQLVRLLRIVEGSENAIMGRLGPEGQPLSHQVAFYFFGSILDNIEKFRLYPSDNNPESQDIHDTDRDWMGSLIHYLSGERMRMYKWMEDANKNPELSFLIQYHLLFYYLKTNQIQEYRRAIDRLETIKKQYISGEHLPQISIALFMEHHIEALKSATYVPTSGPSSGTTDLSLSKWDFFTDELISEMAVRYEFNRFISLFIQYEWCEKPEKCQKILSGLIDLTRKDEHLAKYRPVLYMIQILMAMMQGVEVLFDEEEEVGKLCSAYPFEDLIFKKIVAPRLNQGKPTTSMRDDFDMQKGELIRLMDQSNVLHRVLMRVFFHHYETCSKT